MRIKPKDFREAVNHSLDRHFPKGQCKERSSGLIVFATAILEYEKIVDKVKPLLGGDAKGKRLRRPVTAFGSTTRCALVVFVWVFVCVCV